MNNSVPPFEVSHNGFLKNRDFWIVAAVILAAVFIAGISSKISMGDESFHYRTAQNYFDEGRQIHDPRFRHVPNVSYVNTVAPLWHQGLAFLWRLTDFVKIPRAVVAQGYQALFLTLLLISVYGLIGSVRSRTEAMLSVFFTVTCPLVLLYSVLLYLDVPATAFGVLTIWMISCRRFFLAGLAWAGFVLTKETGFLFLPSVYLYLAVTAPRKTKLKGAIQFTCIGFMLLLPDIWYRWQQIGYVYINFTPAGKWDLLDFRYAPFSPLTSLFLLGGMFPIGVVCLLLQKNFDRHQLVFGGVGLLYVMFTVYMFWGKSFEVRYFLPAIPFFATAFACASVKVAMQFRKVFVGLFVFHVAALLIAVALYRKIPEGIEKAFDVLRSQTPRGAVILYPEENMITYTDRPVVWGKFPRFYQAFWGNPKYEFLKSLQEAHVDFVAIPKRRIYNDAREGKHWGGYPKSFIEIVEKGELNFLAPFYANEDILIYKVNKTN